MTRRIVVTGAGSGIGHALATRLRHAGSEVLGVDLKGAEVQADLATTEGREQAVEAARRFGDGALDALVTCAGIAGEQPHVVAVNYFGSVELCEALRPALVQSPAPRVAVVGSISSLHPTDDQLVAACLAGDEPRAVARATERAEHGGGYELYPSSKAALARWLRRTAVAPGWADAGIALNAVAPGVVLSAMTRDLLADEAGRQLVEQAVPMPLNGHAPPDAIAALLAWLISPDNTHVTGQVIFADGGAEATYRGETAW